MHTGRGKMVDVKFSYLWNVNHRPQRFLLKNLAPLLANLTRADPVFHGNSPEYEDHDFWRDVLNLACFLLPALKIIDISRSKEFQL